MDNQKLPSRKFIRLNDYDYRQPGAYFITICTFKKMQIFGSISEDKILLSQAGLIVEKCWHKLSSHFPNILIDAFIVMPNHFHGIIILNERGQNCRGEAFAPQSSDSISIIEANASPDSRFATGTSSGSISSIIQNFKSNTTRRINATNETKGNVVWQRNFYEHVIRNYKSLDEIRQYIIGNPWNWLNDKYYGR